MRVSVLMAHSVLGILVGTMIRKRKQCQQEGGGVKLSLIADGKSLFLENPHNSAKTLRTHKSSKGAGYKINVEKSLAFLCASHELTERENNHCQCSKQNKTRNQPN